MNFSGSMLDRVRAAWLIRFRRTMALRKALYDPECGDVLPVFLLMYFRDVQRYPRISLKLARNILQRFPDLAQAHYMQVCALQHLGKLEQTVDKAQQLKSNEAVFTNLEPKYRAYIDAMATHDSGGASE